jgi:hypothetical protein
MGTPNECTGSGIGTCIVNGIKNNSVPNSNVIMNGESNTLLGSFTNAFIGNGKNITNFSGSFTTYLGVENISNTGASFSSYQSGKNHTINVSDQATIINGTNNKISTGSNNNATAMGYFNNDPTLVLNNTWGFISGTLTPSLSNRTNSSRILTVGNGTLATPKNAFTVTASGYACAETGFIAGAADFAEWFDSNETIEPYQPVYLENGLIHLLTLDAIQEPTFNKKIIGITTANPLLIGNDASVYQDFLGRTIYKKQNLYSSEKKLIQEEELVVIQFQDTKILSNQNHIWINDVIQSLPITSTEPITIKIFDIEKNQYVFYNLLENETVTSITNDVNIYIFIDNTGNKTYSLEEQETVSCTNSTRSLVGLKGQLILDAKYRDSFDQFPSNWVIIKQNYITIGIENGIVKQNNIYIDQIDSNINQIIYYDKILIK